VTGGAVTDPTEAITQALTEHRIAYDIAYDFDQNADRYFCHCNGKRQYRTRKEGEAHAAAAVVAALTANGWALTELTAAEKETGRNDACY